MPLKMPNFMSDLIKRIEDDGRIIRINEAKDFTMPRIRSSFTPGRLQQFQQQPPPYPPPEEEEPVLTEPSPLPSPVIEPPIELPEEEAAPEIPEGTEEASPSPEASPE